ncbi:hypothetical protein RRF57_008246 [Xylaria bambusicola]|uniref:Uncharacterized protein n=1 Tax=Xylaria bambusicola TaxID=326684 RepID=A0AAN7UP22_9PEZI
MEVQEPVVVVRKRRDEDEGEDEIDRRRSWQLAAVSNSATTTANTLLSGGAMSGRLHAVPRRYDGPGVVGLVGLGAVLSSSWSGLAGPGSDIQHRYSWSLQRTAVPIGGWQCWSGQSSSARDGLVWGGGASG